MKKQTAVECIVSRFTMKIVSYNFTDSVNGKEVFNFIDKYGNIYMAHYPFFPWNFRVKK